MSKKRLLVDAVSIIDCHKLKCWTSVHNHFSVETVEECFKECGQGGYAPGHVPIDIKVLLAQLAAAPHAVDDKMRAELLRRTPNVRMDAGERDLMAYAITQDPYDFILCGPDAALVRAAVYTSLESTVVSLEEVARLSGRALKGLDYKNTDAWLSTTRTKILLEREERR